MLFSIKESRLELGIGIFFAAFSLLLYFVIIPWQIRDVPGVALSPRSFPLAITAFMFFLSLALTVSGWLKRNRPDQKVFSMSVQEAKLAPLTLLIVGAYTYSLNFISYIPATVVCMAALMLVYGQRKWWRLGAMAIILPVCIFLAFTHLFGFRMP